MTRKSVAEGVSVALPLERRAALARGCASALEALMTADTFRSGVERALEAAGQALDADAAYVFEFCADPFGDDSIACQRFSWSGDADSSAPLSGYPSPVSVLGLWDVRLASGEPVCARVTDLSSRERGVLEAQGIEAMLVLPIVAQSRLWGGICFDSRQSASANWSDAEAEALMPLANALAREIVRRNGDGAAVSRRRAESSTPAASPQEALETGRPETPDGTDAARGGFAVVSVEGDILYRSPGFAEQSIFPAVAAETNGTAESPALTEWVADEPQRIEVQAALREGAPFEGTVPFQVGSEIRDAFLYLTPLRSVDGELHGSLCWLYEEAYGADTLDDLLQDRRLHHRVRSERALVEASRLLVSGDSVEMEDLLEIVGEATGADHAYLVTITPDDENSSMPIAAVEQGQQRPPIELDAYNEYTWTTPNADPDVGFNGEDAGEVQTFAVPILSSDGQLFGYLGIEYEGESSPLQDEDARVLNVLGDMLCTYLQRQISERALRRSERRYRHFVDTISEAIWRIEIAPPIAVDQDADAQIDHVLERGVIAECNAEMARLFGLEQPEQLVGWNIDAAVQYTGRGIVEDFIAADYRLRNKEVVVRRGEESARHFIINTIGVVEDGYLVGLWGSSTEVTDRVELERRMVTALEQQQQRIGRDLHDSVGQLLTGVRMLAQNVADRYFGDESPGRNQIEKIIGYANEAAQHVSDLQRGLMPVQMERGGLAQALKELASNTNVFPDLECIYVHDDEADVTDQEVKLQLYRIAQEATNNAVKHAEASYIKIMLKAQDDRLVLQIEDDGVGFDLKASRSKSLGLHSMYYRARSINASLEIDAEPGMGTTIHCEVPWSEIQTNGAAVNNG